MPLVDPRLGDAADAWSSTMQRSWLAMIGSLFAEISLVRVAFAFVSAILLPALALGALPLVCAILVRGAEQVLGIGHATALLAVVLATLAAMYLYRPLRRLLEANFWALNATAVQPLYVGCREVAIFAADRWFVKGVPRVREVRRKELRARLQIGSGAIVGLVWAALAWWAWPHTIWDAAAYVAIPWQFFWPAVWNAAALVTTYAAIAVVLWSIDEAAMAQAETRQKGEFDAAPMDDDRRWRVAHLSDLHVVGERYGCRLETGLLGPRGNIKLRRALARLKEIDEEQRLDLVLISGDLTDAGRSAEWVEFIEMVRQHGFDDRLLVIPGNHDLNVIDRGNPARLEFPFSRGRGLRQIRALSAIDLLQGTCVHVFNHRTRRFDRTLREALAGHRFAIRAFARRGTVSAAFRLRHLWEDLFPMICFPEQPGGLGVVLLNSNAVTSFSFTNALGMITSGQRRRMNRAMRQCPGSRWIVLLHHHLMEYPHARTSLSDRLGTALIDGTWFARRLHRVARSIVVMHGHRHFGWNGRCGAINVVSAPSTVMTPRKQSSTFHILTFAAGSHGRLLMLSRDEVIISGAPEARAGASPQIRREEIPSIAALLRSS